MSKMSKAALILCFAFSMTSQAGEVFHYKGKSTTPTKEGNSVCRVYVVKEADGSLVKISVDGYIVKNYSPGIATRLLGDEKGTSQRWSYITMDTRKYNPQVRSKMNESKLEMEMSSGRPVEDTYEKRSSQVEMRMNNGVPTEAEFSEKVVTKFMVFSDTVKANIICKDLQFVDQKSEE